MSFCASDNILWPVGLSHNEALPFYAERSFKIESVLTDNGREFCGGEGHPYRIYLAPNEIGHRTTKVKHPQTNGFVERFKRTVLDEFFGKVFRQKLYESVELLQQDLDEWLSYYNHERPHQGLRNIGRRPIERIENHLQYVRQHPGYARLRRTASRLAIRSPTPGVIRPLNARRRQPRSRAWALL